MVLKEHNNLFSQQILGLILVGLGAIFFSAKAILVKFVYQYQVDSVSLMALRMLMALPFYLVILFFNKPQNFVSNEQKPTSYLYLKVCSLGILCYYVANYLDLLGLQHIPASLERLILYLYPTFVMIIAAVFLSQRILLGEILALIMSYIGIALVFLPSFKLLGGNSVVGGIWVLGSALAFAVFFIGSERVIPYLGSIRFTCIAMIAASFVIIVHFFIAKSLVSLVLPYQAYIYIFLIAIFSTVLPSFMVAAGLPRLGARRAGIVSTVGPLSTVLLAYLLLGETLVGLQVVGMACVLLGVLCIGLLRSPK